VNPPRAEQPVFLLVAGPNGSGKSSVYRNADLGTAGPSGFFNPDHRRQIGLPHNSGASPRQIGEKSEGVVAVDGDALDVVIDAIRSIETP
jgi:hypothetical protein